MQTKNYTLVMLLEGNSRIGDANVDNVLGQAELVFRANNCTHCGRQVGNVTVQMEAINPVQAQGAISALNWYLSDYSTRLARVAYSYLVLFDLSNVDGSDEERPAIGALKIKKVTDKAVPFLTGVLRFLQGEKEINLDGAVIRETTQVRDEAAMRDHLNKLYTSNLQGSYTFQDDVSRTVMQQGGLYNGRPYLDANNLPLDCAVKPKGERNTVIVKASKTGKQVIASFIQPWYLMK